VGPTVTILEVEDVPKVGKVVHVRIDNVPVSSCGSIQLTTTIEHMALAEKVMRQKRNRSCEGERRSAGFLS